MRTGRRVTFWTLLSLAVISFFFWLVHIPYQPDRVFESIPSNAVWVGVHSGLADDWPRLMGHPAITNLLLAAGVRPEDAAKLASDPVMRRWIRKLAARETVFAYLPVMGYQNQPAWVFATWIGSQSVTLRLKLPLLRSAGLRAVPVEHGRTVYVTRARFADSSQKLSIALSDGMLLGCISSDPAGARWLLETSDRYPWKPSLRTSGQLDRARELMAGAAPPHSGWFTFPNESDLGLAAYRLDLSSNGCANLHIVTRHSVPGTEAALSAPALSAPAHLLAGSPDLIALLPAAALHPYLVSPTAPLWTEAARTLLNPANLPTNALAMVAILDNEHNSRLRGPLGPMLGPLMKGLKLPTLVLGCEVGSPDEANARISQALDQINARYGTGLIPHPVPAGTHTVTLIEETRPGFYSKFEPDERVAAVACDGWLYLCSNATVLKKLLAAAGEAGNASSPPPLWMDPAVRRPASAAAWVDLNGGAKTVKDLAGAAQLLAIVVDTKDAAGLRSTLAGWRTAADLLKPFGQAEAALGRTNGVTTLDIVLGNPR